jgi:hypothetical protein
MVTAKPAVIPDWHASFQEQGIRILSHRGLEAFLLHFRTSQENIGTL